MLITSGAVPVLLTVTVWSAEALPTVCVKLSVVGDTPITGVNATPVPDRLVVLCPPVALCVTTRLALRAPAADGVKPTLMVQLAAAATVPRAVQVPPLIVYSVPLLIDSVPSVNAALPVLDSVTVCAEPAVPTFRLPNDSEAVCDATGAGAAVAVPLSVTLPGLPAALWVMLSVPVRAPAAPAAGRKATEMVQFAPTATLPGAAQVPPLMR